jgi:hypothetical protein
MTDEFIDAEIAEIDEKIASIRKRLDEFYAWRETNGPIACDDSEFGEEDIRRLERKRDIAFIKRVTTLPEDLQITWSDLAFLTFCDSAFHWHEVGFTKESIIDAITTAMQPRRSYLQEILDDEADSLGMARSPCTEFKSI